MTDVDPESIRRTQESLGKFVKKPPLTEKLLKKPPFKFIHDVIKVVSAKELNVAVFSGFDRVIYRSNQTFLLFL